MKWKRILWILLLASVLCVFGEGENSTSSTTEEPTSSSQTSESESISTTQAADTTTSVTEDSTSTVSETSDTAASAASTPSEETSGTSISAEPTSSTPESSISPVSTETGGPTSEEPSTNEGSTAPTTTATTTPSPAYEEFDVDCDNGFCTYTFIAPQFNVTSLDNDSLTIKDDEIEFGHLNEVINNTFNAFLNSSGYLQYEELEPLIEQLEEAIDLLNNKSNEILPTVQNTSSVIDNIWNSLNYSQNAVFKNFCYYQQCAALKTTTAAPTTPTPPCFATTGYCSTNLTWNNGQLLNGQCANGGYACSCPGSLDGNNNCQKVGCYSNLYTAPNGTVPGPLWSPNYLGNSSNAQPYAASQTCLYSFSSAKRLNVTANYFNLSRGASLIFNGIPLPVIAPNLLNNMLKEILGTNTTTLNVRFVSGSSSPTAANYYDFNIEQLP